MTGVSGNYRLIQDRIHAAAQRAGRSPASVQLIAVTKTVSPERILDAVRCGVTQIGENRLQEALSKRAALADSNLVWHFIGRLQTNKAKKIAENFDWVHSIDRLEAAEALARYRNHSVPMPVLIEVKLENEPGKTGASEEDLPELARRIRSFGGLHLKGLMAVPPVVEDPEEARPFFRRLRMLAANLELRELSMGMTHDFEVAIEEGATMVRIGTGLFGARL